MQDISNYEQLFVAQNIHLIVLVIIRDVPIVILCSLHAKSIDSHDIEVMLEGDFELEAVEQLVDRKEARVNMEPLSDYVVPR